MSLRSPIKAQRRLLDFLQPALDAAAIIASLACVRWLSDRPFDEMMLTLSMISVVMFLLAAQLTGLHRRLEESNVNREISAIIVTWALTVFGLAMLGFVTRFSDEVARSVMLIWIVAAPTLIGIGRMCLKILQRGSLQRGGALTRTVAIAGLNDLGLQTKSNIDDEPSLGLKVAGFYDDRDPNRDDREAIAENTEQLAGNLDEMIEAARRGEIDTVFITLPMRAEERIRHILNQLSDSTVSVYIVPDFFVFELLHSQWTNLGGIPAVSVFENPLHGVDGITKRVSDVAIATLGLVVVAIPMMLIAIGVKLTSPGPVFFRQKRYGLDGREIRVWKFRSMRTCDNGPVVKQATKGDPRITRLGGILRKTSLDELPQLFNVIEGTMSLVGPRPHASAHNEEYRTLIHGYMLRHKVKPGITGLAQVNGCRGETETIDKMERRIEWDHRYIRSWSIWLDLKILVQTVLVVWKQDEAY
jgi:putative colanic acid biosynthesis UDP-glucose lipid carrier transferase